MASIYAASSLLKFSPSDTENTVSKLFVGPEKSDLPFTSNADFFCFCAALGKKYKRSSEITEKSGSDFSGQVDEETFKNRDIDRFIFAIALDEKRDLEILKNIDECYKIFQSYVNGGLEIILERSKGLEPLELRDQLVTEVRSMSLENVEIEDEFEDFEVS